MKLVRNSKTRRPPPPVPSRPSAPLPARTRRLPRPALLVALVLGALAALLTGHRFAEPAEAGASSPVPARLLLTRDYDRLCQGAGWREPMDLSIGAPEFPSTPSQPIDWDRAERRIREVIARSANVRIGLVVRDLSSDRRIAIRANEKFASASLVKIPLLITLYRDLADGKISANRGADFMERHRAGGSGQLKAEPAGVKVNLRDLVYLMLQHSDNTATNILADLVGYDHVTRLCASMGWTKTDFVRPVMALELRGRGIENWTTPAEMADMVEKMYKGSLVSRPASAEMIRFMLNPPINDRLPRHLPARIDVVHKTGLIFDNAHDVGILYLPGRQPVLVSAFADRIGTRYMDAKQALASIARVLYEEATPRSARETGRRR